MGNGTKTEFIEEDEKIIFTKDGKEVECDLLFTFECEDTDKLYVGYTDNSIGKNGRKNIYVGSYDRFLGGRELENIETAEEIAMVNDVLAQIDSDVKKAV